MPGSSYLWSTVRLLPVRRVTQAAVVATLVALVAGSVGYAHFDKSVNLSVDGKTSAIHLFGNNNVGDLLAAQDISVGPHDVIAPALSTPIKDGQKVVVRYGRLLTVTLDGEAKEYWTTSTTVAGALTELGIRADSAKLSVSRSQPLGRAGLVMSVTTPKDVTVAVDGRTRRAKTTGATVADLLAELNVTLGAKDRVTPALTTKVTKSGLKVAVARVTQKSTTATETVDFGTQRKEDATMYTGDTKAVSPGEAGSKVVTYLSTLVNGKLESRKITSSRVTTAPVSRVIAVGTKAQPVTTAPTGSTANQAMWDRIAECESGGNWSTNTGNGYYGGLQFDSQTWLGAGGGEYGSTANLATRLEQIAVANVVYADRGLQPWGCGHAA